MQHDYSAGYAAADPMQGMIGSFLPLLLIQIFYAWYIFVLRRKQGKSAWVWAIATLIPLVGLVVVSVVAITTQFSVLDRLNALEGKARSK